MQTLVFLLFHTDNAFGRCEEPVGQLSTEDEVTPLSSNVYQLDRKTVQLLEKEVDRLHDEGFEWKDAYTQCVLKTILNDRPRFLYDASGCDYLRQPPPYVDLLITDPNSVPLAADEDVSSFLGVSNQPDGYFVEEVSSIKIDSTSGT